MTEKWLQFLLAIVVIISTALLGSGLNSITITYIGIAAAVGSFVLTERLGWIRLNRALANLGAIAIAIYSISRFFGDDLGSEAKLAAIASLLTYVQAVLLFQEKNSRLYWNIWVLSLLQVVVAAALAIEFEVGLLFFAFIVFSLPTMCLMTLYVDRTETLERAGKTREKLSRDAYVQSQDNTLLKQFGSFHQGNVATIPAQPDKARSLGSLFSLGLLAAFVAIAFSIPLFYSIPRHDDVWSGPNYESYSTTSFATEISFNHGSVIRPSDQQVMRVRFVGIDGENKDRALGELSVPPYFKGVTLPEFTHEDGMWKFVRRYNNARRGRNYDPLLPLDKSLNGKLNEVSFVRQETIVERTDERTLFTITPCFAVPKDESANVPPSFGPPNLGPASDHRLRIGRDRLTGVIRRAGRSREYRDNEFKFEVAAPIYYSDKQLPAVPGSVLDENLLLKYVMRQRHHLMELPPEKTFPTVYELTRQIREKESGSDRRLLALRLANYFKSSEEFSYTLDYSDVVMDSTLHPLEDFLRNRKAGHCEYYAASLALMLRVAGIPSRIVSGYRGVDFNSQTNEYSVMERDSHAWVEAWLAPNDCSEAMFATGQANPAHGAWLRLDPTPFDDQTDDSRYTRTMFDRFTELFGFAQAFWDDNVVGIDSSQQNDSSVNPREASLLSGLVDGEQISHDVESQFDDLRTGKLSLWHAAFLTCIAIVIAVVFVRRILRLEKRRAVMTGERGIISRTVNRFSPKLDRWLFADSAKEDQRVDFYERFLEIMRSRGIVPERNQTQLEFANGAMRRLNEGREPEDSIENIRSIIDEFYRVRFGGVVLSKGRNRELDSMLNDLESTIV